MKTTIDDQKVPDRCWYYLLDFNDMDHWKTMLSKFDKIRLCDLESHEFWELFEIAVNIETTTKGQYFNNKYNCVLHYCPYCTQMTNHIDNVCQKHLITRHL